MPIISLKRVCRHGLLFIVLYLTIFGQLYAQAAKVPPLERVVSINMQNTPIKEVLNRISTLGKFSFSYSNKVFNAEEKISANFSNKPVRYILSKIFHERVIYKTRGEYIILLANGAQNKPPDYKQKKAVDIKLKVNGYIIDSLSRQKIKDVSIYDAKTLYSSISNDYGYFSIEFPADISAVDLRVRKAGYRDTSIHIQQSRFQSVEISLLPLRPVVLQSINKSQLVDKPLADTARRIAIDADTSKRSILSRLKLLSRFVSKNILTNTKNVSDSFFRVMQFSLLPSIGTNRLFGGNVVNKYSLNLIGGYSQGVNECEVAGMFNIDRDNVKYVQLAGFGNFVGGKVEGVQAAGFMNIVLDSVKAVQASGFINIGSSGVEGVQAAGFGNYARSLEGVQAAGSYNFVGKNMNGVQAAGIFNVCFGESQGTQASGVFNTNVGNMAGAQLAGVFNASFSDFNGVQVSSIFNYAHNLKKGAQISLFNFADSSNGVAIGLFSFVRHGYHKLEVSTDEIFRTNLAFRTGVKKLHYIFSAGIDPMSITGESNYWAIGYGIGSSFKLIRKLDMDLDLSTNYINQGKIVNAPSYNKIYAGFDLHINKNISLAFGPTLNFYFINPTDNAVTNTIKDSNISYMYNQKFAGSDTYLRAWVGAKLALRFL